MRRIAIIVLALATAACGGGGTDSAGSTPPPAPPPTSTQVARQTPLNPSLDALTVAESFNTVASTAKFNVNTSGTVSNVTSTQAGFATDVTIAYNPTNQTYTVSTNRGGISNQTAFTSADLDSTANGVAQYSKAISATQDAQLLLTRPSPLRYSALGAWTDASATSSSALIQSSFFAFGQETAVAAVPKTGSASYALIVAGIGRDGSTPFAIGGSGTANVNFAASSLTTALSAGIYDGTGSLVSTQTLNGTATIASDFARFAGTLQGSVNGTAVSGPMNGAFFGPAAEEIGGSFKVTGGQVEAVGAFVGLK